MSETEIKNLARSLGGIYDRLTKIEVILETRADFEKRIRGLEQSRAWLVGAGAGLGFFGSLILKGLGL